MIKTKVAAAEELKTLTKQIEATQRILDGKRTASADVKFESSPVIHQAEYLSNALSLVKDGNLTPTPLMKAGTNQSINIGMSWAATGLPALSFFVMGLFRNGTRQAAPRSKDGRLVMRPAIPLDASVPSVAPAPGSNTHTREIIVHEKADPRFDSIEGWASNLLGKYA